MAQHGMRTVHSSPQALWVSEQIQSPTGISVSDLGNYGTKGILDDEDDDNEGRPLMFPFSFDISEECRNDLSANVTQQCVSNNYGIAIYQKVRTIINRHHPSET